LELSVKKSSDEIALRFPIFFSFSRAASSSYLEISGPFLTITGLEAISKGSLVFNKVFLPEISINWLEFAAETGVG